MQFISILLKNKVHWTTAKTHTHKNKQVNLKAKQNNTTWTRETAQWHCSGRGPGFCSQLAHNRLQLQLQGSLASLFIVFVHTHIYINKNKNIIFKGPRV